MSACIRVGDVKMRFWGFVFLCLVALIAMILPAHSMGLSPMVAPLRDTRITSGFGHRFHPTTGHSDFHVGTDLAGNYNDPVYALAAGVVVQSGNRGLLGKSVEIRHTNGDSSIYGHLNQINVALGRKVAKGALIGLVGSTGRSTGPHLHLSVKKGGSYVDPIAYMNGAKTLMAYRAASAKRSISNQSRTFVASKKSKSTQIAKGNPNKSKASVLVAKAPPKPSKAEIDQARIAFQKAEQTAKTFKYLFDEGAVSRKEAEAKIAEAQRAQSKLNELQS